MSAIQSILTAGSEGVIIQAESHLSNGLPTIIIVGLGNKAVDEAKDRIRSAFSSNHLPMPRKRVTINLAPADIPKESTSLDLAIALSILQNGGQIKKQLDASAVVIGELGLEGDVRPVRGIIGKILAAKAKGISDFYLPAANAEQALLVPDITIIPIKDLQELYTGLNDQKEFTKKRGGRAPAPTLGSTTQKINLSDIAGQQQAKRALQIAAAGGHNILLTGAPGTGKTMLARTLPTLMPALSRQEMLEVTNLHSMVSGNYERLITERPFRSPHHTASHVSITGGGVHLRPGEISLAHRGVLFLDEFPEFDRPTLEALRQPLEDREIVISRAKDTATYPADFILVATANPCPCGYLGSAHSCDCTANAILRYKQKMSGPIMDRIDIHVTMEEVDHTTLLNIRSTDSHETTQTSVMKARLIQSRRYDSEIKLNANMNNQDVKKLASPRTEAVALLNQAAAELKISARAYMRTLKVARTIADLSESEHIEAGHILEALSYRPQVATAF